MLLTKCIGYLYAMRALFIVGFWNSGTTLLTRLLKQHPALRLRKAAFQPNLEERKTRKILRQLGTDYHDFTNMADVVRDGFIHHPEPVLDDKAVAYFQRTFQRSFSVSADKQLLLKQPYMFYLPRTLDRLFEFDDIKYVVILRNGYSQAASKDYWKKETDNPEEKLYTRAGFWQQSMSFFYTYWANRPDVFTLRYENLCTYTNRAVADVCAFAGIDFEALRPSMPADLKIRLDKWKQLPELYKTNMQDQIQDMVTRVDTDYPIW